MRDEVDIVELDEKYYLFGMKSEADSRRRPIFLCYFREYHEYTVERKVRNQRLVRSDKLFFLEISVFPGRKVHYPERFQAMIFF